MDHYFDHAPCIFVSFTDEGRLVEVNHYACSMLGYDKSELKGNPAEIIFTVPTRIFHQTHLFPLLKMQGHAEEIFITLRKKDGSDLPVLLNAARETTDGNTFIFVVGIIVHHRKKFEEELISAKKIAEKALEENSALSEARKTLEQHSEILDRQFSIVKKQNEEFRQFNHVVTHDLQEPLRKLAIFSEMLLSEEYASQQEELVRKMRRVSLQMKEILSGLQQYVWLTETAVRMEPVELDHILLKVKNRLLQDMNAPAFSLQREGINSFIADAEQIQQLFYQLFSNSIKFSRNGIANIRVIIDIFRKNQYRTLDDKYNFTEHLRIRVIDDGIGFDPQYRSQLFQLFRTLHTGSGRGVGLSLAKKIVENHRGMIQIDSEEGVGTIVTIILPEEAIYLSQETARMGGTVNE